MSIAAWLGMMPAAWVRRSIGPSSRSTSATRACTSSQSATLQRHARMFGDCADVSASAASFMSKIATCAPAAASRSAETLPMPLAPPVTSATLPWKAIGILL